MTINSTGPISLGGNITGQSIEVELNAHGFGPGYNSNGNGNISLDDGGFRTLTNTNRGSQISISQMFNISASNILKYALPGTYSFTIPDGLYSIKVYSIGGGGGAGGSCQSSTAFYYGSAPYQDMSGAGSSGALVSETIAVTPGQVVSIVVGGGGNGGNAGSWVNASTNQAGAGTAGSISKVVISGVNHAVASGGNPGSGCYVAGNGSSAYLSSAGVSGTAPSGGVSGIPPSTSGPTVSGGSNAGQALGTPGVGGTLNSTTLANLGLSSITGAGGDGVATTQYVYPDGRNYSTGGGGSQGRSGAVVITY